MQTKRGLASIVVGAYHELSLPIVEGQVASDGVVYAPVATFGTTALEVFAKLINPGFNLALSKLQVGLTQRFNNLLATSVGSLIYHWRAREEYIDSEGSVHIDAYVNLAPTYSKGIPTSGVSGDPAEDTVSGYVPVGTLKHAPFRISLMAEGLVANSMTGEVKNSSYVELAGVVIPGT